MCASIHARPECIRMDIVQGNQGHDHIMWVVCRQFVRIWQTVGIKFPCTIALPLRVAKLYHDLKGAVMPHKLLQASETHLASPETPLDNGNDWGLVQKWLLFTAQNDGSNPTSKSFIAFCTDALLSTDNLIHRWITNRIDATLGRCPNPIVASTQGGLHGSMAAVHNMSGIIATEVRRGLGVPTQQATKGGTNHTRSTSAGEDAKPYTQDQQATLFGFHGAMNVQYLKKVWRLFKSAKTPIMIT
jgi:hypothetical protein